MIRYTLRCADGHAFESWFQSASAFDELSGRGLVSCAICGGSAVSKAMMAPRVTSKDAAKMARPLSQPRHPAEEALRAMREHLEKNSTYVGGNFAREARAMHVGDMPEKIIHGEANPQEAKALIEDGVPILPLPVLPGGKAN